MSWEKYAFNFLAATLASEVLRPKVKPQGIGKPAGLGDFSVPTASETRPIPVFWGWRKHVSPNCVWLDDLAIEEVKEKVRTGLFSSTSVVKGYNYRVGAQFALCHGIINKLYSIQVQGKDLYRNNDGGFTMGAGFYIAGTLGDGSSTQTIRSLVSILDPAQGSGYMQAQQTYAPRYPGKTIFNFFGPSLSSDPKSGLIGQTPTMPALEFEVLRLPDCSNFPVISGRPLYLTANPFGPTNINPTAQPGTAGKNANPVAALWELLTNADFGAGLPVDLIDFDSFIDASYTMCVEGNALNMIWDNSKSIEEIKEEIERQINGALYTDPATGKLTLRLIRAANPVALQLTPSNISELTSYSKTAAPDATNEVRLTFDDSSANFKQRVAVVQDFGAIAGLGNANINSTTVEYPGITDAVLASALATRDLRLMSGTLAKATVRVLQQPGQFLMPTDKVVLTYPDIGLENVAMRVLAAKYGAGLKGEVELELVEDLYQGINATFSIPAVTPLQNFSITQYSFRVVGIRTGTDKAKMVVIATSDNGSSQTPRIGWRAAWSSSTLPYSESSTETSVAQQVSLLFIKNKTVTYFDDAGVQQTKQVSVYEVSNSSTNALITEPDGGFLLATTNQSGQTPANALFALVPETTGGQYTFEAAEGCLDGLPTGTYYFIKGYGISPEITLATDGFSRYFWGQVINVRGITETVFGSPHKETNTTAWDGSTGQVAKQYNTTIV